jgi:hypothetical protein
MAKQSAETVETSQGNEHSGTQIPSSMDSIPTTSLYKKNKILQIATIQAKIKKNIQTEVYIILKRLETSVNHLHLTPCIRKRAIIPTGC